MLEAWTVLDYALVAVIGLVAGTLGGMLGVGGSVVMIPGLTLVFGFAQHLYQAAAMAANVAVSIPAALRHKKAGAILPGVLRFMLPAAVVFVVVGVALSNLPVFAGPAGGRWLGRLLAVFLGYVIVVNVSRLRSEWKNARRNKPREGEPPAEQSLEPESVPTPSPVLTLLVGAVMGLIAGLLGIGGGAVAVPLQQAVLKLPLRNAIANSSAVICLSAAIGAVYKNATLAQHAAVTPPAENGDGTATLSWVSGVTLAALLAPTAWVGGRLGAALTHRLPIRYVRLAFIVLMIVAAVRMAW